MPLLRRGYFDATAVYCSLSLSFILPPGLDVQTQFGAAPAWANGTAEPNAKGYVTSTFGRYEAGKMRVGYNPNTGRGYVKGALQTFYYGHNSGSFPFTDVCAAVEALSDALQLSPELLLVSTIETGLTFPTPTAPTVFIDSLRGARYKGKPFEAMYTARGQAHPLGYYAPFAEYQIKAYNKGADSILKGRPTPAGGQGVRLEIGYDKARKLAAALGTTAPITLACLAKRDVHHKLSTLLLKAWKTMDFAPSLDEFKRNGIELTPGEARLWITPPDQSKQLLALGYISQKTYERDRATLNNLRQQLQQAAPAHPYTALIERELKAANS